MRQRNEFPRRLVGDFVESLGALRSGEDVRVEELGDDSNLQHPPEGGLARWIRQHVLPGSELHPTVCLQGFSGELRQGEHIGSLGEGVLDAFRWCDVLVRDLATGHDHLHFRGCAAEGLLDADYELAHLPTLRRSCHDGHHMARTCALGESSLEDLAPLELKKPLGHHLHGCSIAVFERQRSKLSIPQRQCQRRQLCHDVLRASYRNATGPLAFVRRFSSNAAPGSVQRAAATLPHGSRS
mmetsp:Transcript_12737/g.28152  ORF Transcript_12737/g.28152 Transcript_12737/m.28152 type:complete len:240 (-) Transcript_12737:50-769(-)